MLKPQVFADAIEIAAGVRQRDAIAFRVGINGGVGGGNYAAAKLLKRMLACGLSRFEPEPLRALAEARRQRAEVNELREELLGDVRMAAVRGTMTKTFAEHETAIAELRGELRTLIAMLGSRTHGVREPDTKSADIVDLPNFIRLRNEGAA